MRRSVSVTHKREREEEEDWYGMVCNMHDDSGTIRKACCV
jgi:hypothetical protein